MDGSYLIAIAVWQKGVKMDDLISRRAAIDAVEKESQVDGAYGYMDTKSIVDLLNDLSSAQPEPCEDAISRRRLLNDLKELIAAWEKYPVMAEQIKGVETAIGYVETIPSVTQKRKTRKWNFIGDNMFECSCCGTPYTTRQLNSWRNKDIDPYAPYFCPNCGADMRGEENE